SSLGDCASAIYPFSFSGGSAPPKFQRYLELMSVVRCGSRAIYTANRPSAAVPSSNRLITPLPPVQQALSVHVGCGIRRKRGGEHRAAVFAPLAVPDGFEDLRIQKEQDTESQILGRGTDVAVDSQIGQELVDSGSPDLRRVAYVVEDDEAPRP